MAKILKIIILIIILGDLVYLNYLSFSKSPTQILVNPPIQSLPTITDVCGPECQKYIDSKLTILSSAPTPNPKILSRSKVRTISYLPIPGSGSTSANDWVELSGTDFYFDTHDYPGLVSIYFETNLHLFNGNGIAFARLYDVTHGIGVQGSEVKTPNQADTALESGQVNFYSGKNLIRIETKSLTADTTVYSSGRLKIISEN